MKPAPFAYVAPESLDEALDILTEHGDEAKWLAGGQSLIPMLNFRLAAPQLLVDGNRISELAGISETAAGGLLIGAMTRQRELERDPRVARLAPLLAEAVPFIAHQQLRNRGTVGGSLAHADPAAELPVVMVTLGARFRIRSRDGERFAAADPFFVGLLEPDLAPGELLVEVEIPPWPEDSGWAFLEVARRRGDYALVGVAARLILDADRRCQEATLVFLSVADKPLIARRAADVLIGHRLDDELLNAAAELAREEVLPTSDIHASADFKRHLAAVLTRRALARAGERARAASGGRRD